MIDEIRKGASLFFHNLAPSECVELRVLGAPGRYDDQRVTVAGYFTDPLELAKAAQRLTKTAGNAFVTINPVVSDLLARTGPNHAKTAGKDAPTTSDKDTARRANLLIDLDYARPAGIATTDAEHQAALDMACEITAAMEAEGWAMPVCADSGNGSHLIYSIDLPNTPDALALVSRVLQAMQDRFCGPDGVKVDQTVCNASRISRLYGLLNRKGVGTPERPHRRSAILSQPERWEVVTREQLEAFAPIKATPPPPKGQARSKGAQTLDLDGFMLQHFSDAKGPDPWQGGRKWVLDTCPFDESHTGGCAYVIQMETGAISAGCHHDSCSHHRWADLREMFDPKAERKKSRAGEKESSQVDKLHELADGWSYVICEGQPYAVAIRANPDGSTRKDCLRFSRGGVRQALAHGYYAQYGSSPCKDALSQVTESLEARATFEGEQAKVWIRTAAEDGNIYLDLCDQLGRVVVVGPEGWSITQDYPVHFARHAKMLPLPLPVKGGSIQELRPYLNVDDASWILIVAWLLFAYCPRYPHPILLLEAPEGAAKSNTARYLRDLIDPNSVTLRKAPKDGEDIAIAACNNWICAYDNIGPSLERLSDELCGLATGSGHARRAHYSNDEESSYSYLRPCMLTGLPGLMGPPDFVSRTLKAEVPVITDAARLLESELQEDMGWVEARPRILGAVLDAVACALANHGRKRLAELPRLADFAQTVVNAEDALPWEAGHFMRVFTESRLNQTKSILEADPLAVAIRGLMDLQDSYSDTATGLCARLAQDCTNDRGKTLPGPHKITTHLRRLQNSLRATGIGLRFTRAGEARKISIYLIAKHVFSPPTGLEVPQSSLPSPLDDKPHGCNGSSVTEGQNQSSPNRHYRHSIVTPPDLDNQDNQSIVTPIVTIVTQSSPQSSPPKAIYSNGLRPYGADNDDSDDTITPIPAGDVIGDLI